MRPENATPRSGDRPGHDPGRGRAVASAELFLSADELASRLGVSRNLIVGQTSRGELTPERIGSRTLYPWPQWQLRALGINTPRQIGELCRGLGIDSLDELLQFISGDRETP